MYTITDLDSCIPNNLGQLIKFRQSHLPPFRNLGNLNFVHLTFAHLPSLPLLLILDSQCTIPSKNTLWPLALVTVRACCISAGLVSVWLLMALNSWSILSMNSAVPQFTIIYSNNIQQTLQLKTMSTCCTHYVIHKNVKTVINMYPQTGPAKHNSCGHNHNNKSLDM